MFSECKITLNFYSIILGFNYSTSNKSADNRAGSRGSPYGGGGGGEGVHEKLPNFGIKIEILLSFACILINKFSKFSILGCT